MIFATRQARSIAHSLPFEQGRVLFKYFSDGELYVKVEEDVQGKHVWVIGSTASPCDNILELFLLLDALKRAGASINLLLTYFGYARQDRAAQGEALGSDIIATSLKSFNLDHVFVIHAHSQALHTFLDFQNLIPLSLFCYPAQSQDRLAAPDKGAYELACSIAKTCNLKFITVTKMRPEQERVAIVEVQDNIAGKKVLIVDDMISTGNTILQVAQTLKEMGAATIQAAATHGVFSDDARDKIENSPFIEKVYVTDSLPQQDGYSKIEVLPIAPFIEEIINSNGGA